MSDTTRFGMRLKELREQAGLSQKELADKAGLSLRAISHWEQGMREPSWSNVQSLATALDVDCRAFTEQPADQPPAKPGRPRKEPEPPTEPTPPKKRGRPKKGDAE